MGETILVGPVADALSDLSETDRSILSMTFVEELNATEIAGRLGMNASTVRTRKERLLKRLAGSDALRALHEPADADELDDAFEEASSYTPDLQDFF